jgi:hypothetical protein
VTFRLRREGNLLFCVPAGLTRPGPALYLTVAGISAGGAAAAATLLARGRGGPSLDDRNDSPSARRTGTFGNRATEPRPVT